ncbi:laminin [Haloferula helveola]|uniref:Laminin n=1 Tax=Haloferula helveola TaxID=490095 RepID=A0ABM7RD66_9BACT|nr:laminin [Haloferula helveola]
MNLSFCRITRSLAWIAVLQGAHLSAQSSPYRGLWVGEATLGAVNEVSVPLDAQNIPRAPDPNVPTPTSDAAKLRLILHVDAAGQVSLLKHVAILARKAGVQESENDLALVTDERLYGQFPPQPARRISSVVFDFGDPKATGAVNEIAERAAAAAATAAQLNGATVESVTAAAQSAAQTVIAESNAAGAFNDFLEDHMTPDAVKAIALGGPTDTLEGEAEELRDSSFFGDDRGLRMLEEILNAVAALPPGATDEEKEEVALKTAASFVETDRAYDRFLASELFGDMIRDAAEAAAEAADGVTPVPISSFQSADSGAATGIVSPAHGLVDPDEIAIFGSAIGAYNGIHLITKIDDDTFSIDVPFVVGGTVDGYGPLNQVAPTTVETPDHGLSDGDRITLRDSSLSAFNGKHFVSVLDADHFTIDLPFDSDPATHGVWSIRSGEITGYAGTGDGSAGIAVTAPGHGLNNGEQIEILGSGEASYNGLKTITRIDDDTFSIPQAFGGNPAVKGTWDVPRPIASFAPPAVVPTLVSAPAHGLGHNDRIVISGSGNPAYNAEHDVTVVDADSFAIGIPFEAATGDPATKGSWQPAGGGSWRSVMPVRTAMESVAKVNQAKTEALTLKVPDYIEPGQKGRAQVAVDIVLEAILERAAMEGTSLAAQGTYAAAEAGWEALAADVPRYPTPTSVPSLDYADFIASDSFSDSIAVAAAAAAEAAVKESENVIATPESIELRALNAAIDAIVTTFSAASRALLTELPMTGTFGSGGSGLSASLLLPANHPTNPFRHRRHPDHARGFDVTREIDLSFFSEDDQPLSRAGYGVDRISGVYEEEIFGLHKPLGPDKDIGLKVRGSFQLQRISLIDTLNGR